MPIPQQKKQVTTLKNDVTRIHKGRGVLANSSDVDQTMQVYAVIVVERMNRSYSVETAHSYYQTEAHYHRAESIPNHTRLGLNNGDSDPLINTAYFEYMNDLLPITTLFK